MINKQEEMVFNSRYSAEERFLVNPKDLRFTQPDIKSTFTDPTHPSVTQTASLIRRGELKPDDFGPLHVSIDEHGRLWCDNNRRLFASRQAGVDSVPVIFDGTRRPKYSLKDKLSDPAFVPRIRGEASRVQISPPPSSGRNGNGMQKGSCLPGFVSGGYLCLDEEDEDELGASFTRLGIKSSSCPESLSGASGVPIPLSPTSGENAYQRKKEPSLPDFVSGGYLSIDEEGEDWWQQEPCEDEGKTEYCISAFPCEDEEDEEGWQNEPCEDEEGEDEEDEGDEEDEDEEDEDGWQNEPCEDEDDGDEEDEEAEEDEDGRENEPCEDEEDEGDEEDEEDEYGQQNEPCEDGGEDNDVHYCISDFSASFDSQDEVEYCYYTDDDYDCLF